MEALLCSSCTAPLEIIPNTSHAKCEFCGTVTAIPKAAPQAPSIDSFMQRGHLLLEDGNWAEAGNYFDAVLDINPQYAPAYIGKLCAEIEINSEKNLIRHNRYLTDYGNFNKALRFADADYANYLNSLSMAVIPFAQEREANLKQLRRKNLFSSVLHKFSFLLYIAAVSPAVYFIIAEFIKPEQNISDNIFNGILLAVITLPFVAIPGFFFIRVFYRSFELRVFSFVLSLAMPIAGAGVYLWFGALFAYEGYTILQLLQAIWQNALDGFPITDLTEAAVFLITNLGMIIASIIAYFNPMD